MKQTTALWLVILLVVGAGCASTPVKQALKGNLELQQAYQGWREIDPSNLTAEQQQLLAQFQQDKEHFVNRYDELIQAFPWIDAHALTPRDEVFLMAIIDQLAELDVRSSAIMTAVSKS
ncbi:MAG: hypothetical protein WC675_03140 [Patescibacteria group bacterium]|jgi:hypothetical protein